MVTICKGSVFSKTILHHMLQDLQEPNTERFENDEYPVTVMSA